MVADTEIVRERMSRAQRYLNDLMELGKISEEDFRTNRERQYAVLHALQLAIEACIEMGTHICAADAFGVPSSYAETFTLLGRAGIIDDKLKSDLEAMARFRNRIVHFYWEVDTDEVYAILRERLGDFAAYLRAIDAYLSKAGGEAAPGE
jgi:uncharacterized protein YutE (UPF0331/DUF86 family)